MHSAVPSSLEQQSGLTPQQTPGQQSYSTLHVLGISKPQHVLLFMQVRVLLSGHLTIPLFWASGRVETCVAGFNGIPFTRKSSLRA